MRDSILPVLVLVHAACGDNLGTHDAVPGPDARSNAARAVIVSGDFAATGILSTLDLPERTMHPDAVDGIAGIDPVIRRDGNTLYVVNRLGGDNVTILAADTLALIDQIGTGASSNPQDVAAVGNTLFVPALAATGLIVIDRAASNAISMIDLASLDPADGHPDCVSAYAVGTTVFVACGILDDVTFMPRGPGKIAIINATLETLTGTLDLPAANPISQLTRTPIGSIYGGDLVIGTVPSYSDFSTGCLARISVGATPAANGCAFTNEELGGYANHIEASDDGALLWLAVDGFTTTFEAFGALRGIDLASGVLWAEPVSAAGQVIVDVATCPGGIVIAADGSVGASGIRVYDNAVEVTTEPMPFGLPPAFGANMVCYRR